VIKPLDDRISDASLLISMLLVFAFAYFSALLPQIEDLRARPRPNAEDDRHSLDRRLMAYEGIAAGLAVIVVLIVLLLVPLSIDVMKSKPWHGPFDTLRIGLLLVDLLLVATATALLIECLLLRKRRHEVS